MVSSNCRSIPPRLCPGCLRKIDISPTDYSADQLADHIASSLCPTCGDDVNVAEEHTMDHLVRFSPTMMRFWDNDNVAEEQTIDHLVKFGPSTMLRFGPT